MELQQEIEKLLPDDESWEWHDGARYRIKQINNSSTWYGLRIKQNGDQIEAKPIIIKKGDQIEVIQGGFQFSSLDQAINQLEDTERKAIENAR